MKQLFFLGLLSVLGFGACNLSNSKAETGPLNDEKVKINSTDQNNRKNLVLVELFTSEGCSSCPPAERALAKLQKDQPIENAEIVTLAFHVDYWNYLGWKDEFSSPKFSQRQTAYAITFGLQSNYTPQMIVDGKQEFVGSKWASALSEIRKTARDTKGEVDVSVQNKAENSTLKVKISKINSNEDLDVWLAIAEDNLETNVKSGENSGKKLNHISVVRNFVRIGDIAKGNKSFETEKILNPDSKWKKENLNIVVFAQGKESKNVVALGKTKLVQSLKENSSKN
jgi:hypothetical protein